MAGQEKGWKLEVFPNEEIPEESEIGKMQRAGKAKRVFSVLVVLILMLAAGLLLLSPGNDSGETPFESYLRDKNYEEAYLYYKSGENEDEREKNCRILSDVLLELQVEYEENGDEEVLEDIENLYNRFRYEMRREDRAFYQDLKNFIDMYEEEPEYYEY